MGLFLRGLGDTVDNIIRFFPMAETVRVSFNCLTKDFC